VIKPEWGIKRHCQACGVNFYDLKRSPIVCPKCSEVFDPEAFTRSRRSPTPAEKKTASSAKKKAADPLAKTDDKTDDLLSAAESLDNEGQETAFIVSKEPENEFYFKDNEFEDDEEEVANAKPDDAEEKGAVEAEAGLKATEKTKAETKKKPAAKPKTGTKKPPLTKGKKA
jgi:uncharacterized protein (TIGR02300 family)